MEWRDVGDWLKNNAGPGAALVGSLLTGNIPGAIAAGVSLVGGATGEANPDKSLAAPPVAQDQLRRAAGFVELRRGLDGFLSAHTGSPFTAF